MFHHVMHFAYKRNRHEAIGFYIAWLLFTMLASGALSALASIMIFSGTETFKEGFSLGVRVGTFVSLFISTGLAFVVAKEKEILGEFQSVLLIFATAILAGLGGGLLGILIPAYLSTRDARGEVESFAQPSEPPHEPVA